MLISVCKTQEFIYKQIVDANTFRRALLLPNVGRSNLWECAIPHFSLWSKHSQPPQYRRHSFPSTGCWTPLTGAEIPYLERKDTFPKKEHRALSPFSSSTSDSPMMPPFSKQRSLFISFSPQPVHLRATKSMVSSMVEQRKRISPHIAE